VGLKTTRIRSLSGEQLIFSNSDLTKSRIKNYKRMETRRIVFKIGVVYQTSLEKVLIGIRFSSVAGECRAHTSSASAQEIPQHFGE